MCGQGRQPLNKRKEIKMTVATKEKFDVNMNDMLMSVLKDKGTIATCYSNFHNYSIRNQFLAFWQMKSRNIEVSPINNFNGWKNLKRSVKKGEKAIYLWQPFQVTEKDIDENGNEVENKKLIFRYLPRWFALSQTDGQEFKPEQANIKGFDLNKVYKKFEIEIIPFDMIDGNCQGFAKVSDKKLAINPVAEHPEMTILHEVAHIALKHNEVDFGRDLKELEAETVAYIIGSILDFDDKLLSDSRGYVQGWFKGNTIPDKNATRIMRVANDILKAGLGE